MEAFACSPALLGSCSSHASCDRDSSWIADCKLQYMQGVGEHHGFSPSGGTWSHQEQTASVCRLCFGLGPRLICTVVWRLPCGQPHLCQFSDTLHHIANNISELALPRPRAPAHLRCSLAAALYISLS